jgi:hypothetical protein
MRSAAGSCAALTQVRMPPRAQVLCGWYGAQDKHLAKYSELVNGLGYHTLRVQMPPATVFSLRCARRLFTQHRAAHAPPKRRCRR